MTHDLPIPRQDERSDGPDVVEWGTQDEPPTGGRRVRRAFSGLGWDHRVPLLLAGLGAAAAVGSLLGEWVTLSVPSGGGPENLLVVPSGVAEIGGLGIAYLLGLLALGSTVALALRGTCAVRANARVAGLSLAAGLLAVLAATVAALDDSGRRLGFYIPEENLQIEHGRGPALAFAAVLLFAAALARATAGAAEQAGSPADRGRRRSRLRLDDPDQADDRPPADITVTPTVPFARGAPSD